MKKLAYLLPLLVLAAVVVAPAALAQAPTSGIGSAPAGGTDIGATGAITDTASLIDIILGLVNWVAWFVALVAVIFGLYAGFLFITAGGDEAKLGTAKNILIYSVIGIVVAIFAFSIVAIARSIAGI